MHLHVVLYNVLTHITSSSFGGYRPRVSRSTNKRVFLLFFYSDIYGWFIYFID